MRQPRLLLIVLSVLSGVFVLALAGVAFASAAHSSAATTAVSTKETSLGTILVTSAGKTLYLDTGDKPPHFACTGGCLKAWPPLKATGKLEAKGAAKQSLLGEVKGPGGEMVTYDHHPLYTFASDTASDPTSGEGVNGFYAVSPAGSKVPKPAAKHKPPSSTPGY